MFYLMQLRYDSILSKILFIARYRKYDRIHLFPYCDAADGNNYAALSIVHLASFREECAWNVCISRKIGARRRSEYSR